MMKVNRGISTPYSFTKDESSTISSRFSDYRDWNKIVFKDIKGNIINHYRKEQDNQCCYCKSELGFDIKQVDIEHFLSKRKFSHFTFEPLNLSLSCPGCNTKKNESKTTNYEYKVYPKNSRNLIAVHPHFDDYIEHIEIQEGLLYVGITKKGTYTIYICELCRLRTVEAKAKALNNKDDRTLEELEKIRLSDSSNPEELRTSFNFLLDILKKKEID